MSWPLIAAAEDAEQDEEEVDEVEVEAKCQQQRVIVARPLGLDPPEVEERKPHEHHSEEEAERQLADGKWEDHRSEADHEANEERPQQLPPPRRHVDAGQIDARGGDKEDPDRTEQCAANG